MTATYRSTDALPPLQVDRQTTPGMPTADGESEPNVEISGQKLSVDSDGFSEIAEHFSRVFINRPSFITEMMIIPESEPGIHFLITKQSGWVCRNVPTEDEVAEIIERKGLTEL